jgi:hypothetical protein
MTFAPGAIMDMRAGSAPISGINCGLEEWDSFAPLQGVVRNQRIIDPRLCAKLGKDFFRLPPVEGDTGNNWRSASPREASLVMRRFPEWLQCPECSLIKPAYKWNSEPGKPFRYCAICSANKPTGQYMYAVPVRFIAACTNGHLEDFPWDFWVGHKKDCTHRGELVLDSRGAGLAGLHVSCKKCKSEKSLDKAFRSSALTGLKCRGKRPWLRVDDPTCDCKGDDGSFRVVQRGASNLYYSVLETALSIPPWTRRMESLLDDRWMDLKGIENSSERVTYISHSRELMEAARRENLTAEELNAAFEELQQNLDTVNVESIRNDEFKVLSSLLPEKGTEFETYPRRMLEPQRNYFESISRVARLREVRVLKGFTRINPPFDVDSPNISPISVDNLNWLPAIEVRGEGIFVRFAEDRLQIWENQQHVLERCESLDKQFEAEWMERFPDKPRIIEISPRRLLVHTFAHAVIKQLTLECGYSTASLRERLYVGDAETRIAGVLIYTGTTDSDGTLGGLQSRGREGLFEATISDAISSMQWCSSDPLCIHGDMSQSSSISSASCHACVMVPETSCEENNRFLDRALLVGTPENSKIGYFSELNG